MGGGGWEKNDSRVGTFRNQIRKKVSYGREIRKGGDASSESSVRSTNAEGVKTETKGEGNGDRGI